MSYPILTKHNSGILNGAVITKCSTQFTSKVANNLEISPNSSTVAFTVSKNKSKLLLETASNLGQKNEKEMLSEGFQDLSES